MHMIIKFETFTDMCSTNNGLNTFKTPQNDKNSNLNSILRHLPWLMLPTKLIAIKYGHNKISTLCGRP